MPPKAIFKSAKYGLNQVENKTHYDKLSSPIANKLSGPMSEQKNATLNP